MPKSGSTKKEIEEISRDEAPKTMAHFGSTIFLNGELSGNEDLVIEGKLHGKINLGNHSLVIEQGGKVRADIRAGDITINGKVEGNIHATDKVFVSKDASMKGDIHAPKISIMDGAQFKGSIKIKNK